MAKKILLVDDLDGSEIEESDGGGPIKFSLGDDFYQMDLGSKSLAKLTKALQPFIEKASKVEAPPPEPSRPAARKRGTAPATGGSGLTREELDAVRTWARANGHEVAARGRIKAEIIAAWEAATKS